MRKKRRHDWTEADEQLAALIARTDWPDIAGRLLLYVVEQLVADGQLEGRYPRAKAYVERAVTQFFDNQREFTLISEEKLFDCLCVITNCLRHDDGEEARIRAERAAPLSADTPKRTAIIEKLWAMGGRKQS